MNRVCAVRLVVVAICAPPWLSGCCCNGRCGERELECDDGVSCTVDFIEETAGACAHEPLDERCDDGMFCTGREFCSPEDGCLAGEPPECDDGVACTDDRCDDAAAACVSEAVHGLCDDGIECTVDTCNVDAGGCTNELDDAACDDHDVCNGVERCDATRGCVEGAGLECDDGEFCNGSESCHPGLGCQAGEPELCDDGVECTEDACDEAEDVCLNEPDDESCSDSLVCNGIELCDPEAGCLARAPPDCDFSGLCVRGRCDESAAGCVVEPDDGAACDAGGGVDSGRCFERACLTRGCGDAFVELGPDLAAEECDPGPSGATAGCTSSCESIDFLVSDLLPSADRNGSQELGTADRAVAELVH